MSDMQLAPDAKRWRSAGAIIKCELQEFRTFLKRPKRGTGKQAKGWAWLARLAGFFLLLLLLYVPVLTVLIWLDARVEVHSELDFGQFGVGVILMIGLVGPVLEEIIFRAGLRGVGYSLYWGPVAISIFLSGHTVSSYFVMFAQIAVVSAAWLVHLRNVENSITKIRYSRQFLASYPIVFWLYTIAFSQMHILNYSFSGTTGLAIVLFQAPQLLAGIVLGYLRLRDGLRSSITLHCLHNLLALWLAAHADKCPGLLRFMCE